jgi:hypothetical protein
VPLYCPSGSWKESGKHSPEIEDSAGQKPMVLAE